MSFNSHQQILDYQKFWSIKFELKKEILENMLGDSIMFIDHIGSTSISGLSSKPIIDIAVMIRKYADRESLTKPLGELGYAMKDPGNERDFYKKGNPIEFHVSVCFADRGGFYIRQIAFRDFLRTHKKERIDYDNLKRKLLAEDPSGIEKYIFGKTDFVNEILQKANWKEETYNTYKNNASRGVSKM